MRPLVLGMLLAAACIRVDDTYTWDNPYDPRGTVAGDPSPQPGDDQSQGDPTPPGDTPASGDPDAPPGDVLSPGDPVTPPGDGPPPCVNGWCAEISGTTATLRDVDAHSSTEVWAVGGSSTILKRDTAWGAQTFSEPDENLLAVAAFGDGTTAAGSSTGSIWELPAGTAVTANLSEEIRGIWGASASAPTVASATGVHIWNGTNWVSVSATSSASLYGIWGSSTDSVWAVGASLAVFHDNGTDWTSEAVAGRPWIGTGGSSNTFGTALAWGDVNQDGYDDLVVGDPNWTDTTPAQGRIFLYYGGPFGFDSSADWYTSAVAVNNAHFGASVSVGDVTGDGFADIAVGAPGDTVGITGSGSVHLFLGGEPSPTAFSVTQPSISMTNAALGTAVLIVPGLNGDSFGDVLVGAPNDGSTSGEGVVYIYQGNGSGISLVTTNFLEPADQNGARFGRSLARVPLATGNEGIAVGAPMLDGSAGSAVGGVWVYQFGQDLTAPPTEVVSIEGEIPSDGFGTAIASVDIANDGVPELAVSEPGGSRVRFHDTTTAAHLGDMTVPGADSFGQALAAGDVNGDDQIDLVVGGAVSGVGHIWVAYIVGAVPSAADWDVAAGAGAGAVAVVPNSSGDQVAEVVGAAPGENRVASHRSQRSFQGSVAGMTWPSALDTIQLNAVHGSGSNDVWAVGNECVVLHWNGIRWSRTYPPCVGQVDLFDVHVVSETDVWVVGMSGWILHWNNGSWIQEDSGNTAILSGVWADASNVWAVGSGGVILHKAR